MSTLLQLYEQVRRHGWACGLGDPATFIAEAKRIGWEPVIQRRGEGEASTLIPVTADQARPRSLSATYGLGPQPLHTDGAHLPTPPDVLMLYCEQNSSTDTLLWRSAGLLGGQVVSPPRGLWDGMFLVENGRDSFYSPARDVRGYRYDPGCMQACDQRAAAVVAYFTGQLEHAEKHSWAEPGTVLMLDNRSVLHARAAVTETDRDRELIRVAFSLPART